MNNKKWLKSQVFFIITTAFGLCCIMTTDSWTAIKIMFCQAHSKEYKRMLNEINSGASALRHLYDPPLDIVSIDHVDDYYKRYEH